MHVHVIILWNKKKRGGHTSLHPTQPMAFPPLTVKARGRTARGLDGASPPPAKLARDSSADYQELRPHARFGLPSGRTPVIWGRIKGGTRTDPRPYRPRPRWKFSFHTYQPQPGFPKEAISTRPDLLRTPKGTGSGHRLTANKWLHQRSQLGLTLASSQGTFACTHSDELCEVTRGAKLKGRLLYSPRRLFDYGFRLWLHLIGRQFNLSKINCSDGPVRASGYHQ